MSCSGGLHTEAEGGKRVAEDTLLPGNAGDLHQGCETRSTQGRNPDHKESPLITLYRVRLSGSPSGRPTSRLAPGPGASGGHAEAAGQGGGVLQPGPAAGSCGGDIGAAGQDDLPAGEGCGQSTSSSVRSKLFSKKLCAGGAEAL